MVYIIPNFIVLLFGENFMKIKTKIAMLWKHENLHKNVELRNCEWYTPFWEFFVKAWKFAYKCEWNMYSFTFFYSNFPWVLWRTNKATNALHMLFIHLKGSPVLLSCIKFPDFDYPNVFFPKFNRPLAPTSERFENPCQCKQFCTKLRSRF